MLIISSKECYISSSISMESKQERDYFCLCELFGDVEIKYIVGKLEAGK